MIRFYAPASNNYFTEKQVKDIRKRAKSILDKIYSFEQTLNHIDVVGTTGGDSRHLRFYADGTMTEK